MTALVAVTLFTALASCGEGSRASFRSVDGYLLKARIYGDGPTTVILTHDLNSDKESWRPFAKQLASKGYSVITFDLRGHSGSEGSKALRLMDRDVLGAVAYAKKQGSTKIVLIGEGIGGTASLIAAEDDDVTGVVAVSSPDVSRGLTALASLPNIRGDKLFIAALGDKAEASDAKQMFRLSLDPGADLLLLPGNGDGINILYAHKKRVSTAIFEFLSGLETGSPAG